MTPTVAIGIARIGVKLAAQVGAAQIVGGIVARNVAMPTVIHQVTVRVGALALGGAAAHVASEYVDYQFNEAADAVDKIKQMAKEQEAARQSNR